MVVKTKNPENGWSDPVKLQFEGIDPSLFFDDNGKAYVYIMMLLLKQTSVTRDTVS